MGVESWLGTLIQPEKKQRSRKSGWKFHGWGTQSDQSRWAEVGGWSMGALRPSGFLQDEGGDDLYNGSNYDPIKYSGVWIPRYSECCLAWKQSLRQVSYVQVILDYVEPLMQCDWCPYKRRNKTTQKEMLWDSTGKCQSGAATRHRKTLTRSF